MTKKKTIRRTAAPKTRNAGTMSESAFWTFIRSALRQKSRWWKPITECKLKARRPYKGVNRRQKFEYQCNTCKKWFPDKEINVDHIVGAGSLNWSADLAGFVDRLFCEQDNLQVLCETCHNTKTQLEKQK
jgi:5-methylcytosine-specific restriction endonuclease McrA